ncbi:hypothetical protein HDU85_006859 [Gaertneriomyces sp. JEL0708]|nr:hypothetical protein HDU85_006859 [Gaertneriomyces sp. JEL0708]
MSAVYNENLRLPTWNPTGYPERPIPNIQGRQYGFIQGKPGAENTFNRAFREPFFVPKGEVSSTTTDLKFSPNPRFKEAEYVTKVEKDAVAAFLAVEKEKSRQAYFDELDSGNLFPRQGRIINLPRSVAIQVNSDGSTSAFHQPSWVRAQQNQTLGDTTKRIERSVDPRAPTVANAKEKNVILGQNHTVNLTNSGIETSTEVGRIGSTNKVELQSHATSPIQFPSNSVTKDFRTSPMDIDTVKYPSPNAYKLEPMDVDTKYPSPTKYDPPKVPNSKTINWPKVPRENSDEELYTRTHLLRAPSAPGGPWSKRVVEDKHEAQVRMQLLNAPFIPTHDPSMGWWRGGGGSPSSSSSSSPSSSPGSSPEHRMPGKRTLKAAKTAPAADWRSTIAPKIRPAPKKGKKDLSKVPPQLLPYVLKRMKK